MHVSIYRHLAKAVSYRILGTITTVVVGLIITGNLEIAASLGIIDIIIKTVLYYVHERIWYHMPFGIKRP